MKRLLFATVITCLAAPAQAFIVLKNWNGETETWPSNNVTWTLSSSVMDDVPFANLQAAIAAAFQSWQDVACATVAFTYGGQKAADPQNGIHFTFRQNGWDPSVADALAYSVSETDADGAITSNDIVFNAYASEWSTATPTPFDKNDIQGVATHEIGHSLGLDHSREFAATMFFSGGSHGLRSLEDDDQRGLCFLYPTTTFTSGRACDACNSSSNCQNGTCLDWGGGHSYCGQNCGGGNACPNGFTCYQIEGVATPQCLPDMEFCHDYGGKLALGEACFGNSQCASAQCIALPDEAYCSKSCNAGNPASCGAGYTCVDPGVCLAAGSQPYGGRCQDRSECATAECVFFQFGSGVCTEACGAGNACPNGDRCYEDSACVPPGVYGVGTPCGAPDQCRGMFCENAKCTAACSGGVPCPPGATCESSFCQGAERGAPCTVTGQCPASLTCQKTSAESAGVCERQCNAFTDAGCENGEVCAWTYFAWNDSVVGRCVAQNSGAAVGESCAEIYCEANLDCRFRADLGGPICHKDCRVTPSYGCDNDETCKSLDDPDDPNHGICVPKAPVGPDPDPDPPPDADPTDTTTPTTTATATDIGGADTNPVIIGSDRGGCGGAGSGAPFGWLAGLLALGAYRRRRVRN